MIAPLLLVLAAAGLPDAAGEAPSPTVVHPAATEVVNVPEDGSRAGWRHAIGVGGHSTTFFSKEGSQYTFHSVTLGYMGSIGRYGAFWHATALLPFQARQDGAIYATANYYRRRTGGDLLVGAQGRWDVRGAELEAGPGLHATLIYLPGRPGYRDFSAFPLGLGAGAVLRWRTSAKRLSRAVTVGAYASAAYDFRDPAHAEDLAHGFTFRVGLAVGLGGRL
jgi:hypothetical protein